MPQIEDAHRDRRIPQKDTSLKGYSCNFCQQEVPGFVARRVRPGQEPNPEAPSPKPWASTIPTEAHGSRTCLEQQKLGQYMVFDPQQLGDSSSKCCSCRHPRNGSFHIIYREWDALGAPYLQCFMLVLQHFMHDQQDHLNYRFVLCCCRSFYKGLLF